MNFEFVQSFCSTDNFRLNLTKPTCYESGLVISTDAHKLLMFFDKNFQDNENVFIYDHEKKIGVNAIPTIEEFVESHVKAKSTSTRIITTQKIDEVVRNVRTEIKKYSFKYIECEDCEGKGEIYCHCCDNSNECKSCDGIGEQKVNPESIKGKSPKAYYKYPEDVIFKIDENLMRLQIMSELSESLKIIGKDTLEVIKAENLRMYFRISGTDYYILCMGVTSSEFKHIHSL